MIFNSLITFSSTGGFKGTILSIMLVLTAVGCFLVGVNLMSKGLVKATMKENSFFTRGFASKNRLGGIGSGILYTVVTQSSDVTAVTLVRLADLGIITLFQACACIIGANIGTTVTSFIVSLSSFELTPYFAFLAFVGAIPLLSKKKNWKIFGEIVAGFGVLFIGLQLLDSNVENEDFRNFVSTVFNFTENPFLLILIGAALTAVMQSSSVVTAIVVFLISGAFFPLKNAFCLVAGANIGTCFTSWIAAFGSSKTARQTAFFHTMYNIIGTTLFLAVMLSPIEGSFLTFAEGLNIPAEFKVALFHLTFNVCAAVIVVPLLRPLVWFSSKVVRH